MEVPPVLRGVVRSREGNDWDHFRYKATMDNGWSGEAEYWLVDIEAWFQRINTMENFLIVHPDILCSFVASYAVTNPVLAELILSGFHSEPSKSLGCLEPIHNSRHPYIIFPFGPSHILNPTSVYAPNLTLFVPSTTSLVLVVHLSPQCIRCRERTSL